MSIYSDNYHDREFAPAVYGAKKKRNRVIKWAEICEPVGGYRHIELLLAGAEAMIDSSRSHIYSRCRWGTQAITGLLLESSAVNMEGGALKLNGTLKDVEATLMRSLTVGMLTQHYGSPQWRAAEKIGMAEKVNLAGPFSGENTSLEKAWDRLLALNGKDIKPMNESHPGATRITFTGIEIQKRWKGNRREWKADFYVQYPREKFGSGWELSFLDRDHDNVTVENRTFFRTENETASQWLNRVADYVESLLQPRKKRK